LPSGLVIPHILIGGCIGRLWGVGLGMMNDFQGQTADPGIYGLFGAAAMLAGSGRVPLFFAAVMIDITNDTSFIPPLVLAAFLATITGNKINHGYYHELIHLNHLPLLDDEPCAAHEAVTCASIMATPVVTLRSDAPVAEGVKIEATHAAFPVVDAAGKLVGLADKADLIALAASAEGGETASVMDATDPQVASARVSQPAAFAFSLYRRLGQRHVPIVNEVNEPVGMITRHELDAHKAEHVHANGAEAGVGCVRGVRGLATTIVAQPTRAGKVVPHH